VIFGENSVKALEGKDLRITQRRFGSSESIRGRNAEKSLQAYSALSVTILLASEDPFTPTFRLLFTPYLARRWARMVD
jgi:hypothetical protein